MKPKPKRPLAIWREAFPKQAAALRPENGAAGGVKARSESERRRMEVYNAIKDVALFGRNKDPNVSRYEHICEVCHNSSATEIHHIRGRAGLLLFDMRYWRAVCSTCHAWIHAHPEEARNLGLLAQEGEWNKP